MLVHEALPVYEVFAHTVNMKWRLENRKIRPNLAVPDYSYGLVYIVVVQPILELGFLEDGLIGPSEE